MSKCSILLVLLGPVVVLFCSREPQLSGTMSGTENTCAGIVRDTLGEPIPDVVVALRSSMFSPFDTVGTIQRDTTNSDGYYEIPAPTDNFSIEFKDQYGINGVQRGYVYELVTLETMKKIENVIITPVGQLEVVIPKLDGVVKVWIAGTGSILTGIQGERLIFETVPSGERDIVFYSENPIITLPAVIHSQDTLVLDNINLISTVAPINAISSQNTDVFSSVTGLSVSSELTNNQESAGVSNMTEYNLSGSLQLISTSSSSNIPMGLSSGVIAISSEGTSGYSSVNERSSSVSSQENLSSVPGIVEESSASVQNVSSSSGLLLMTKTSHKSIMDSVMHISQPFQLNYAHPINDTVDTGSLNNEAGISVWAHNFVCFGWNKDIQEVVTFPCGETIITNVLISETSWGSTVLNFDVVVTGQNLTRMTFDYIAQAVYSPE